MIKILNFLYVKLRKAYHIPISKSRNVYGVADLSRKLKKNECFIQVTEHAGDQHQLSHENRSGLKVSFGTTDIIENHKKP